jgi:hypothetical protein
LKLKLRQSQDRETFALFGLRDPFSVSALARRQLSDVGVTMPFFGFL